jgi:hypothetical protein
VSAAPDIPSSQADDYRDPVDDVTRSYEQVEENLTGEDGVLEPVQATTSAPSELADAETGCAVWDWLCDAGNYITAVGNDIADTLGDAIDFFSEHIDDFGEMALGTLTMIGGGFLAVAGGTLAAGGAAACGTGVLCPAGIPAIGVGTAAAATGIGIFAGGAAMVANGYSRLSDNTGGGSGTGTSGRDAFRYIPAPNSLPGFPGLKRVKPKTPVQGGGGKRVRWKDSSGNIYEWDSRHGEVEKYDKRGRHVGAYDPNTGAMIGGPKKGREVER